MRLSPPAIFSMQGTLQHKSGPQRTHAVVPELMKAWQSLGKPEARYRTSLAWARTLC